MYCNGACCLCSVPCNRVVNNYLTTEKVVVSKMENTNNSVTEKNSVVELFGKTEQLEQLGTYEIKKNIFGKEKIKKVKNESRTIGIEYTTQR